MGLAPVFLRKMGLEGSVKSPELVGDGKHVESIQVEAHRSLWQTPSHCHTGSQAAANSFPRTRYNAGSDKTAALSA